MNIKTVECRPELSQAFRRTYGMNIEDSLVRVFGVEPDNEIIRKRFNQHGLISLAIPIDKEFHFIGSNIIDLKNFRKISYAWYRKNPEHVLLTLSSNQPPPIDESLEDGVSRRSIATKGMRGEILEGIDVFLHARKHPTQEIQYRVDLNPLYRI